MLLYNKMARTFSQILKEVSAKSDPQRKIVLGQISSLPQQQQAEESSLEAKKTQAFDEILGGARRRGLGFSGIPLGEQAEYSATEYAPAVARLKTGFNERRGTLESALADIGRGDYMSAQDIYDRYRQRQIEQQQLAEQQRQFNLNYKLSQQAAADASRSASGGGFSPTLGATTGGGGKKAPSGAKVPAGMQALYNQVFVNPKGGAWDDRSLVSDYNATYKSAGYGNARDKQKLQLYHLIRPDLFGGSVPGRTVSNKLSY